MRQEVSNLNIRKYISLLLALLLLALGIGTCGVYISYNDPVVREYSYESSKISEPVKVVVLTDLHGNQFGKKSKIMAVWAAFLPTSYRLVHKLYTIAAGTNNIYEK